MDPSEDERVHKRLALPDGYDARPFHIDVSQIPIADRKRFDEEGVGLLECYLASVKARDANVGEALSKLVEMLTSFGKMVVSHLSSDDFSNIFGLLSIEGLQAPTIFLICKLMDISDDAMNTFTEFGVFPLFIEILQHSQDPSLQLFLCDHLSKMVRRYSTGDELVPYMNKHFIDSIRPFCSAENPCASFCIRMLEDAVTTTELIESAVDLVFSMAFSPNIDVAVNAMETIVNWMPSEDDVNNVVSAAVEDATILAGLRERLGSDFPRLVQGVLRVFSTYMLSESPREIALLLESGVIDITREILFSDADVFVIEEVLNLWSFIANCQIEIVCPFLDRLFATGLDFSELYARMPYRLQYKVMSMVLSMAITAPGVYTRALISQRFIAQVVELVEGSEMERQVDIAQALASIIGKNDGRSEDLRRVSEAILTAWCNSEQCLDVCPDLTSFDMAFAV